MGTSKGRSADDLSRVSAAEAMTARFSLWTQFQRQLLQRTAHFAPAARQPVANPRRFNNKAMGVAPKLFTTFGVWFGFCAGDMVNVQMRFAHHQGSTINQLPAAGWSGHSGTRFSLPGIRFQGSENPSGPSPESHAIEAVDGERESLAGGV